MVKVGFLPCFSRYLHTQFPITNFYNTSWQIDKVKNLMAALIDSLSPFDLKQKGIGKEIQTIRPNSHESKKLINLCSCQENLYRIDYGDNKFRIVFSLSNRDRMAYIYAIDTSHLTFCGKHQR